MSLSTQFGLNPPTKVITGISQQVPQLSYSLNRVDMKPHGRTLLDVLMDQGQNLAGGRAGRLQRVRGCRTQQQQEACEVNGFCGCGNSFLRIVNAEPVPLQRCGLVMATAAFPPRPRTSFLCPPPPPPPALHCSFLTRAQVFCFSLCNLFSLLFFIQLFILDFSFCIFDCFYCIHLRVQFFCLFQFFF